MSVAGSRGLSSAARIREAALAGFARDGVKATSIRDVAAAAGVSPGLVQHHFPSKAALQDAVDQHVLAIAGEVFSDLPDSGPAAQPLKEMADRVTEFVRDNPVMLRYVARSIIEGEETALRIFDGFVALADTQMQRFKEQGYLHEDADLPWAALHVVIFNLSAVLFETALDRRLPAPFHTPEMLERWNEATANLFRRGIFRPEAG
jgi:AcrR family transcriptional regulator